MLSCLNIRWHWWKYISHTIFKMSICALNLISCVRFFLMALEIFLELFFCIIPGVESWQLYCLSVCLWLTCGRWITLLRVKSSGFSLVNQVMWPLDQLEANKIVILDRQMHREVHLLPTLPWDKVSEVGKVIQID